MHTMLSKKFKIGEWIKLDCIRPVSIVLLVYGATDKEVCLV